MPKVNMMPSTTRLHMKEAATTTQPHPPSGGTTMYVVMVRGSSPSPSRASFSQVSSRTSLPSASVTDTCAPAWVRKGEKFCESAVTLLIFITTYQGLSRVPDLRGGGGRSRGLCGTTACRAGPVRLLALLQTQDSLITKSF